MAWGETLVVDDEDSSPSRGEEEQEGVNRNMSGNWGSDSESEEEAKPRLRQLSKQIIVPAPQTAQHGGGSPFLKKLSSVPSQGIWRTRQQATSPIRPGWKEEQGYVYMFVCIS